MDTRQRGVQWEGGAVDGGSIYIVKQPIIERKPLHPVPLHPPLMNLELKCTRVRCFGVVELRSKASKRLLFQFCKLPEASPACSMALRRSSAFFSSMRFSTFGS